MANEQSFYSPGSSEGFAGDAGFDTNAGWGQSASGYDGSGDTGWRDTSYSPGVGDSLADLSQRGVGQAPTQANFFGQQGGGGYSPGSGGVSAGEGGGDGGYVGGERGKLPPGYVGGELGKAQRGEGIYGDTGGGQSDWADEQFAWMDRMQKGREEQRKRSLLSEQAQESGSEAIRQGRQIQNLGTTLGASMSPFDRYRDVFAKQLMGLQRDPSSISRTPGYLGGLEGVQRSMASQGYQGSGNMMAELQKYSGDFYGKQMDRLAGLAGAGAAPGAGAGLAMSGMQAGAGLIGQGLASQGYATAMMNPLGH